MSKNTITKLWPIYIGEFINPEHSEIKSGLIDFFEKYKQKNLNNRKGGSTYSSDENLYMGGYDLHLQKDKYVTKLLNFIGQGFLAVSQNANKTEIETYNPTSCDVTISSAWFIDYQKGGFSLPHSHPNCSWSSVYYVQIGADANENNGTTFFQKTRPNSSTTDFGSYYNKNTMKKIKPEEGKLVIWPNYLMHGLLPYTGEKNRIIVSANALVSINENK